MTTRVWVYKSLSYCNIWHCREFLDGWRRYRREVLEEKQEFMELERLAVEVGDGSDVRGDAGGIGGR